MLLYIFEDGVSNTVRPKWCRTVAAVILSLSLIAGPGAAWAQTGTGPPNRHGRTAPVTGLVTALSHSSLQVETRSGSVDVTLTNATRVTRLVTGSGADLATNTRVDLRFRPDTTVVDAVQINLTDQTGPNATSPAASPANRRNRSPSRGTYRPAAGAASTNQSPKLETSGQVTALRGQTITIRDRRGQLVTYTLADTVDVTKVMTGQLSDLAIGEMVRLFVFIGRSTNTCLTITILSA